MYHNPMYYNNFFPYQTMPVAKHGLFSGITGGIRKVNWGNLLNTTQKTLNVINQAIPVYHQVKPIYNNAKTMFRVFNAMKDNQPINNQPISENKKNIEENHQQDNGPIFFS